MASVGIKEMESKKNVTPRDEQTARNAAYESGSQAETTDRDRKKHHNNNSSQLLER